MARSTTAKFGMNKIRCVTINVETHVASMKTDDGVCLFGIVVHHHLLLFDGVGGGKACSEPILLSVTSMVGLKEREM